MSTGTRQLMIVGAIEEMECEGSGCGPACPYVLDPDARRLACHVSMPWEPVALALELSQSLGLPRSPRLVSLPAPEDTPEGVTYSNEWVRAAAPELAAVTNAIGEARDGKGARAPEDDNAYAALRRAAQLFARAAEYSRGARWLT